MHCNRYEGDGRVEDVVTTSKRIANGRKKATRSARDQKFAMASCLTETKLNEAPSPLIISGSTFANHSLQDNRFKGKSRSSWLRMTFGITLHVSVTHAVLSRLMRV